MDTSKNLFFGLSSPSALTCPSAGRSGIQPQKTTREADQTGFPPPTKAFEGKLTACGNDKIREIEVFRGAHITVRGTLNMIKGLPNSKFYMELMRLVRQARRSIVVVNYIAEFVQNLSEEHKDTDPVQQFANALVMAARRGVRVTVILEGSKFADNYPFYRFLKDGGPARHAGEAGGADVWLDTSLTMIHEKAVLVDDEWFMSGSHNISRASFTKNEEFSVITNDKGAIGQFRQALKKITSQRRELKGASGGRTIKLSAEVVKFAAGRLFKIHAGLAFDLYMILCLEDGGRPGPVPIDAKRWGKMLGFDPAKAGKNITPDYRRYYYTQRMGRIVRQLARIGGLIEVDRIKDTITRLELPDDSFIEVPEGYFQYGWAKRLSFAAKYFYLISLVEKMDSPFAPWWSLSLKRLTKKYGCSAEVMRGVMQLENYNVLEVLRGIPIKRGNFISEEAQYYRLNPLYNMRSFERRLSLLTAEFSSSVIKDARKTAGPIYALYNIDTIREIALLIKKYGRKKVLEAARQIDKLQSSSSRRCVGYLEELTAT